MHERLMAAARAGDREALGELVHLHGPQVLGACRRMLREAPLAEEAFQEACVIVLLNLDLLRQPDRFGAWFTGIALNVCRRVLRERRRERLVASPPAVEGGCVEDEAMAALEARRVREAIGALPGAQREAVLLFYVEGLTQAEVAEQLGIEVGAVKSRLHRARAALRRRLTTSEEADQMTGPSSPARIEMTVTDVHRVRRDGDEYHIVTLTDTAGRHTLPIWVGPAEARSIALQLEGVAAPRPMTAALAGSLVVAAGGSIREVRIERLDDEVFYAVVAVAGPDGVREVDARPSDAISLAMLAGSPILVSADVVAQSEASRAAEAAPMSFEDVAGAAEINADTMAGFAKRMVPR
jgi:RNA polymerase sigma factor (sigma-70 family)